MDMHSRNEYLKLLRERYLRVQGKKGKSQILDEYCLNTGQSRKYVIRKMKLKASSNPGEKEEKRNL